MDKQPTNTDVIGRSRPDPEANIRDIGPRAPHAWVAALIASFPVAAHAQSLRTWLDGPPDPPPLHGSALWTRFLLENPYPLGAVLLVASVLLMTWRTGPPRRRTLLAGMCATGALAVMVLARAVTTTGEAMAESTRELIDAAGRGDAAGSLALLAPEAALLRPGSHELDRDEIADRIRRDLGERFRLREIVIQSLQTETDAPQAGRVQVKLRAQPAELGIPIVSWWLFEWRRTDAGRWLIVRIEPTSIPEQVDDVLRAGG